MHQINDKTNFVNNEEKVREKIREQSEKEAKDMNLNSVKICFEAFVLQNEALYPICPPVYSRPIANQSKFKYNIKLD